MSESEKTERVEELQPKRRKFRFWRIVGIVAAVAIFACIVRFFVWRARDAKAWPIADISVTLSREEAAVGSNPLEMAAWQELEKTLPPLESAPSEAYRKFHARGAAALTDSEKALFAKRLGESGKFVRAQLEAFNAASGLEQLSGGSAPWNQSLSARSGETAILLSYAVQAKLPGFNLPDMAKAVGNDIKVLTRGAGLVGRATALNDAMTLCREISLLALEAPVSEDEALETIAALRDAESEIGPLADAFRDDLVSVHVTISAMYRGDESGSLGLGPIKKIDGLDGWFIRTLGGTEEITLSHMDALFSRFIANAEKVDAGEKTSRFAILEGLPPWCVNPERHAPWTRDFIGAQMAGGALGLAANASSIAPAIILELRAARTTLALRMWRDGHGEWPIRLSELLSDEKIRLLDSDIQDPFAKESSSLRYALDGDGWRFYSCGPDQTDEGGRIDLYMDDTRSRGTAADIVFSSGDREIRKAFYGDK